LQVLVATALLLAVAWSPRSARAAVRAFAAPGTDAAATDGIVVLSLNVFGLPWPLGCDVAHRCAKVAAAIRASAPDFVALQEVWDRNAREPLLVDGWHAAFCEPTAGLLGQSGLLTLSRLPIVATSSHRFRQAAGVEVLVGKGALCVVVQSAAGGQVAVWNVHLQSGLEAGAVRREQFRELAAWIRGAPAAGCIVLGDFNCGPGDPEWNALEQAFDALGLVRVSGDEPTYDHRSNPLAAPEPPAAIDHVFARLPWLRGSAAARRAFDAPIDGAFVSDHFGQEVRLPATAVAAR
jgi:endonuclease/exonuclease/phosphatase family metal-dependent hydrolase